MARGVRTKQLSRKRLAKTARPSKSCVVHSYGIVGKTGKVPGCGQEGRSRKFHSSANSPILEQSRSDSVPCGLSGNLPLSGYDRRNRDRVRSSSSHNLDASSAIQRSDTIWQRSFNRHQPAPPPPSAVVVHFQVQAVSPTLTRTSETVTITLP